MIRVCTQDIGRCLVAAMVLFCATLTEFGTFVDALGDKTSSLPLFESTPVHCDEMVKLHRWEGSCCSLNVTNGNGCILNVMSGYCEVRGQEWTLNYTSTYEKPCPPSEYSPEQLGMKIKKADESSAVFYGSIVGKAVATTSIAAVVSAFII